MKHHINEARYYEEAWISNEEILLKQLAREDRKNLTFHDLIRYDQIDHVGGIKNTQMLADCIYFEENMHILDIGAGLGGPARFLASMHGCQVKALDLIPKRCQGGIKLTQQTGLTHLIDYVIGNASSLPFQNESFDLIWSQDAFDSVQDKDLLIKECYRVLKPKRQIIFTDHLQGPKQGIPDGIYLWPEDAPKFTFKDYQNVLEKNGFDLVIERDLSSWALLFLERTKSSILHNYRSVIIHAQGSIYYQKLLAFLSSLINYLKMEVVQYGLFLIQRKL